MIKKLLFLLLLSPATTRAQYIPTNQLEVDGVDIETHQHVRSTYWHTLRRATLSNPLNLFFRITAIDDKYQLHIKASMAGMGFLVAHNEPLDFLMEDGSVVSVYNSQYTQSCKGCGDRNDRGDKPGVSLTYPLKASDLDQFRKGYTVRLRFYAEGSHIGAPLNFANSELFNEEANLLWSESTRKN
jgi:hypothetical protein